MLTPLNIVVGQLNFCVGDIRANAERMIAAAIEASTLHHADLIVFPELALSGYYPEDLLLRSDFHQQIQNAINTMATTIAQTKTPIDILFGHPLATATGCYNAASYLREGQVIGTYCKQKLPNYGVFEEKRQFIPGTDPCVISVKGLPIGIVICEDLWNDAAPCDQTVKAGARLIISLNASPFHVNKFAERENIVRRLCLKHAVPVLYAQTVGAQDEMVFDGGSFLMDASGNLCHQATFFAEECLPLAIQLEPSLSIQRSSARLRLSEEEQAYQALVLGLRDYLFKNRFKGALVGLSGGIDSALVLAIAVDALGADNVEAVLMPSRYTATISNEDAISLVNNLGVKYSSISIEPTFTSFLASLATPFNQLPIDSTEENIQARCRGTLLMALSNKTGKIVLTTGNKSEMAMGYATLYGDMAGGFAVLKDVPKTLVYQLAHFRNRRRPDIPSRILTRAPSAELAPNQKDEDTLPPYDILDAIIQGYVEKDESAADIIKAGFAPQTVEKILHQIQRNEYKRRQSPPGVRITSRSFGKDRRYPITCGFDPLAKN